MAVSRTRKRKKNKSVQYIPKQIIVPGVLPDGTEVAAKVKINKYVVVKHRPNGQ